MVRRHWVKIVSPVIACLATVLLDPILFQDAKKAACDADLVILLQQQLEVFKQEVRTPAQHLLGTEGLQRALPGDRFIEAHMRNSQGEAQLSRPCNISTAAPTLRPWYSFADRNATAGPQKEDEGWKGATKSNARRLHVIFIVAGALVGLTIMFCVCMYFADKGLEKEKGEKKATPPPARPGFVPGNLVSVKSPFFSNNDPGVQLHEGEIGLIQKIDEVGHLLVRFNEREISQWIFEYNFNRLRATRQRDQ